MNEAARERGGPAADPKAALVAVPLVPLRFRGALVLEVLLVLLPLLYIFAGWRSNG